MDKLYASLKVTDKRLQEALAATAHRCVLQNKETLPGGLPKNTWIFIENGFVKKTISGSVEVNDLLPEGACILLTGFSSPGENRPGVCIQATEPTILYYLLPHEVEELSNNFPAFGWKHFSFTMCAAADIQKRSDIWDIPPADRLTFVKDNYPFLLRAGAAQLADYLRLTGKEHTALIAYFN